jgi:hypothetical protein
MLRCPGVLSVARRLPPLETVIRGRGIISRVFRCDSRKYMHIRAQYAFIPHIHTNIINTYIYIHIRTYRQLVQWQRWKQQYTCRYMHIHAYTYFVRIIFRSTYICLLYVNILHIRPYTCKVKNDDLERVPKTKARILYVF